MRFGGRLAKRLKPRDDSWAISMTTGQTPSTEENHEMCLKGEENDNKGTLTLD